MTRGGPVRASPLGRFDPALGKALTEPGSRVAGPQAVSVWKLWARLPLPETEPEPGVERPPPTAPLDRCSPQSLGGHPPPSSARRGHRLAQGAGLGDLPLSLLGSRQLPGSCGALWGQLLPSTGSPLASGCCLEAGEPTSPYSSAGRPPAGQLAARPASPAEVPGGGPCPSPPPSGAARPPAKPLLRRSAARWLHTDPRALGQENTRPRCLGTSRAPSGWWVVSRGSSWAGSRPLLPGSVLYP